MSPQKFACISLQTNQETKDFLSTVALLLGYNDVSSFILESAQREAQNMFEEEQLRFLSDRDRDLVLDLINSPPEPNENLVALVRKNLQYFNE